MLKTHGRYNYSSLPNRAQYEWPNGTKLAVYVAMNCLLYTSDAADE